MFTNRKYTLTLLIQAFTAIALCTGLLSGSEYVTVTTLVMTVYVGGNVTQKIKTGGDNVTTD